MGLAVAVKLSFGKQNTYEAKLSYGSRHDNLRIFFRIIKRSGLNRLY